MTLEVWQHIRQEVKELAECEPMLASFFHSTILKHQNLGSALSYLLANKLANPIMPAISLREIIEEAYQAEPNIIDCAACDIKAVRHRDPAVELWLSLIHIFLGLVVPSSSGLAVLAMPIMAPLADTVGIPRDIVVSAYNWGQYIMLFLAPTGLVLVTLQMLGIPFNKWLKFVMPIVGCQFVISSILLLTQVFMYAH